MSVSSAPNVKQARLQADELEKQLEDHLFIGGAKPSKEDVDRFYAMFGEQNLAVYRWVRHMASFTELERKSWDRSGLH